MQKKNIKAILEYLAKHHGTSVKFLGLSPFSNEKKGLRQLFLLRYEVDGKEKKLLLKTFATTGLPLDGQWAAMIRACVFTDPFRTHTLGVFVDQGDRSAVIEEFRQVYLLEEYAAGELLAQDLLAVTQTGWSEKTATRVKVLAKTLAAIHKTECRDQSLASYVRTLYGGDFGLWAHLDANKSSASEWQENVIQQSFQWRTILLTALPYPRCIHGDCHAWNIIFTSDEEIKVTGVQHTDYGLPADDIAAFTINFFSFAIQHPEQKAVWQNLYTMFLDEYLSQCSGEDQRSILMTLPFFLGWRAVVLSNPQFSQGISKVSELFKEFAQKMFAMQEFIPCERYRQMITAITVFVA